MANKKVISEEELFLKAQDLCEFITQLNNKHSMSTDYFTNEHKIIVIESKYFCFSLFAINDEEDNESMALNIFFRHDVKASYATKIFMKLISSTLLQDVKILEIEDFYESGGNRYIGKEIREHLEKEKEIKVKKIQNKFMDDLLKQLDETKLQEC